MQKINRYVNLNKVYNNIHEFFNELAVFTNLFRARIAIEAAQINISTRTVTRMRCAN